MKSAILIIQATTNTTNCLPKANNEFIKNNLVGSIKSAIICVLLTQLLAIQSWHTVTLRRIPAAFKAVFLCVKHSQALSIMLGLNEHTKVWPVLSAGMPTCSIPAPYMALCRWFYPNHLGKTNMKNKSPKTVKYTVINTLHNTQASFLAAFNRDGAYAAYLSIIDTVHSQHQDSEKHHKAKQKLSRIWRKLCGISGCMCGGMIRGAE